MNKDLVEKLLLEWEGVLIATETNIDEKIDNFSDGHHTRVSRVTGGPIIFDLKTSLRQKAIQQQLCAELSQLTNLIQSEPVTHGYKWKVSDYVELYLQHYRLVIQKIKEAIAKTSS